MRLGLSVYHVFYQRHVDDLRQAEGVLMRSHNFVHVALRASSLVVNGKCTLNSSGMPASTKRMIEDHETLRLWGAQLLKTIVVS